MDEFQTYLPHLPFESGEVDQEVARPFNSREMRAILYGALLPIHETKLRAGPVLRDSKSVPG